MNQFKHGSPSLSGLFPIVIPPKISQCGYSQALHTPSVVTRRKCLLADSSLRIENRPPNCNTSTGSGNLLPHSSLRSAFDRQLSFLIFCNKSRILCLSFAMRSSVLLFYSCVACIASLTKEDCGDDPTDCDVKSLHINTSQDPQDEREQIGIDQGLLDNLRFFSQFAAASYWPGNTNSTGDLLKCSGDSCPKVPAGNCPDVEKGEYMTISEWKDFAGFDDHGEEPYVKK